LFKVLEGWDLLPPRDYAKQVKLPEVDELKVEVHIFRVQEAGCVEEFHGHNGRLSTPDHDPASNQHGCSYEFCIEQLQLLELGEQQLEFIQLVLMVSAVLLPQPQHAMGKVVIYNKVQVHCSHGCHKLGEHDLIGTGCKVQCKVDVVLAR
jgi:hypothetical protein